MEGWQSPVIEPTLIDCLVAKFLYNLSMKIIREKSIQEFLYKNEELLLKKESEHNLLLGLALGIRNKKRPSNDVLCYTIEKKGTPVGQVLRTDPGKPLILSCMNPELILPLVETLKKESIKLKGVIGSIELATLFKVEWGTSSIISMHQGIYQLDKVIHPAYKEGRLCKVTKDDLDLALQYCLGFVQDCFPNESNPKGVALEAAKRHIENNSLFFWKDDQSRVVSMAANTRETMNGATISWVYTPKEFRGQGNASRVVAALSQRLLDDGKVFTNLFTDLLNPTSNSIYKKIGYIMIAEGIHFSFT
ncbi:MAG: putative GNAT family acetyltransferase [Bacteriovoracaceae bacterium]|jgi:predicted GNAT family acetyltransferase